MIFTLLGLPAHGVEPLDATIAALPDLFGETLVLGPGVHVVSAPLANADLRFVGEGPATVLEAGDWAVTDARLVFQDLTLRSTGSAAIVGTGLSVDLVRVDVSGTAVDSTSSLSFTATEVVHTGAPLASIAGGEVTVTDTSLEGLSVTAATTCRLLRVGAVCAAGAVALDCGATDVAGSVFAGTSAPALTLAGGDARLAGDTFVDVPGTAVAVALGSLTVDGSVFAHVGTAVDGLLTTLPGGSGNWIFDGAPGIAPPEPENPRDPTVAWVEGACGSTADLVAAAPAGFSTDPGWDADADTSPRWVDCDDHAVAVYPGAPELPGSGVDEDCDGFEVCFEDADGDGFGLGAVAADAACSGLAQVGGDCDDASAARHPGAIEVCDGADDDCGGVADEGLPTTASCPDADGDGRGSPTSVVVACATPVGHVADCDDCDDTDDTVFPGAVEVAGDGVDQDCDLVDPPRSGDDLDGDGFCTGADACDAPNDVPGDCDDADPTVAPDQLEDCSPVDRDCDGDPLGSELDADGDGYGACGACGAPCDCDDDTVLARPEPGLDGCDGIDGDCDGELDEDARVDADGDGVPGGACPPGPHDCDDADGSRFPGNVDAANGVDDDCDGVADESETLQDHDGDGFCTGSGAPADPGTHLCAPGGAGPTDCDDADPTAFPRVGAFEEPVDGVDNDCDGAVDEDDVDADGDGLPASADCDDADGAIPRADELCNGFDDDCVDGVPADELDLDRDGWRACEEDVFGVLRAPDCDDHDPAVHPYQPEDCGNGVDDNCNTWVDRDDDIDRDGDGRSACDGDCEDGDALVNPAADERCNFLDDDCNGRVDDGYDADGDGGLDEDLVGGTACAVDGVPLDCDDANTLVRHGLPDVCGDGFDNDCNGVVDDGSTVDDDGDGFSVCGGDCDDTRAAVHPAAVEQCDAQRIDHDCDGQLLNGLDVDLDGFAGACAGDCAEGDQHRAPDLVDDQCDGVDNDCSFAVDDHVPDSDDDGYVCDDDCGPFDPLVGPDQPEVCGDELDNDCAGGDEPCPEPPPEAHTGEDPEPEPPPVTAEALPRGWFCAAAGPPPVGWAPVGWAAALTAAARRRSTRPASARPAGR
jgi:hypothetical protein